MAVSSVFYPKTGFTAAVVFGCNKSMRLSMSASIENSEDASTHPLLIIGIMAEIERERHFKLVTDRVFQLLERVYAVSNTDQISATSKIHREHYSVNLWMKVNQLR